MSGWMSAATRFTQTWVGAYTTGLSRQDREVRHEEINSDLWEHQYDRAADGAPAFVVALEVISRVLHGMPSDILWRFRMEGPKMEINIPLERLAGALLIALVVMLFVTASISGYDTGVEGFDAEMTRLANLSTLADNVNMVLRLVTGLGIIGAAAGFYVALQRRSQGLAALAGFGLVAAGVLALVAGALQVALVELAEQFVASSGTQQDQVLVTARSVALLVEATTGAAFITLLVSTYPLALLLGKEKLVPRWAIALPLAGGALMIGAGVVSTFSNEVGNMWLAMIGGGLCAVLWLVIAGLYLIFRPQPLALASEPVEQPASA